MPTANWDASFITQKNRAIALNSFKNSVQAANLAGTSVRVEQPSGQLQEVIAQRVLTSAFTNPATNNADCGCTNPVLAENTAIANNVQ